MAENFIIGWQEWLALPDLGLPAVKAKIDTGARSSALHAFLIEPFGSARAPMVRFGVHPIPGRLDVAVFCSAPIVDRREVTSSNGEKETRYFIRTPVALGNFTWPIEIGLTNRESMTYRMLLGRQGLRDDMMVDAQSSFRQPKLSYKAYRGAPRQKAVRRALRIALVGNGLAVPFNQKLADTASERGHTLEALELQRLTVEFQADECQVLLDADTLPHYDAVVPRIGRREIGPAAPVLRQLEIMGTRVLNPARAIATACDRLDTAQTLLRNQIPQSLAAGPADSPAPIMADHQLRVLVAGDSAVAILMQRGDKLRNVGISRHRAEQRLAEHAAVALGLGIAGVDLDTSGEHPLVAAVTARPRLGTFANASGVDVAAAVIDAVEASVLVSPRRRASHEA